MSDEVSLRVYCSIEARCGGGSGAIRDSSFKLTFQCEESVKVDPSYTM